MQICPAGVIHHQGSPIWKCTGTPAVTASPVKAAATSCNQPIACGGVAVFPGDIIFGDHEAVIVIPAHLADEVAAGQPTAYTQPTNDMLDALAALPYKQRAAVTLRYWADWPDDQIAEALDCAPATVRVLLHRGIDALKKEIEE